MADKSLKISIKSDLREGQKLSAFIADLQQRVDKFSKTLGSISIGGAGPGGQQGPGQQGLLRQLTEDKKAMEVMGRETESLQRRYQNLGNELAVVSTKMQRFQAASGQTLVGVRQQGGGWGFPPGGGPPLLGPGGGMGPVGTGGGFGPPGGGFGPPGGGGGPGGAGAGGWGGWMGAGMSGAMGMMARLGGWGTIARNLTEGALGAPQREVDWASVGGKAAAGGGADMGTLGARMLGGDVMPAVGLMRSMGRGKAQTGMTRGDFETIVNAAPDVARNIAIRKGLNLSMVEGLNRAGQAMTEQQRAGGMNEMFASFIQMGERQDVMQTARMSYAQAQAPGRVGFARRFGEDFKSAIPLGGAVDPQQVMATVSSILDALGTGTNITKVTKLVTEATRVGISRESIQIMLRAQEIGGGDLVGRILGSALSRPMMGRAGEAAAAMAQQSLLALNPETFAGGFMAGGAGTTELTQRRLQAGAGFLSQVTTGALDPYQATVNVALATKRGRSVYTTQPLSNMPFAELANAALNGPTPEQQDAGITKEMAREQFNKTFGSLRNRLVREGGVNAVPGIRAVEGLGEDPIGNIEKMQRAGDKAGLRRVSSGLSLITGQPLGVSSAEFLGGMLAPGAKGAAPVSTPGRFGSALEASMAGSLELERDVGRMKQATDELAAVVAGYEETVKGFADAMMSITPEQAQSSMNSLMGLGNALGDIAVKGPDAVSVLNSVRDFIESVSQRKTARTEAIHRSQVDWSYMVVP